MSTELANRIFSFIEKHAGLDASYDPEFDAPEERFSSPDACMLNAAALALSQGKTPVRVHSTYSNGGYHPWNDKEAEKIHDELVREVNKVAI